MKPNKKDLIIGGLLAIVTIFSVLANTLWFGTIENPFHYTFSMIGNRFDRMSEFTHSLHTLFAILFGISLSGSLFYFIKFLKLTNETIYGKSMLFLIVIILGSLVLLILFGNSGIFELFFFLALSAFLLVLNKWLDYWEIED